VHSYLGILTSPAVHAKQEHQIRCTEIIHGAVAHLSRVILRVKPLRFAPNPAICNRPLPGKGILWPIRSASSMGRTQILGPFQTSSPVIMGAGNLLENFDSVRNSHTLKFSCIFMNSLTPDCCAPHNLTCICGHSRGTLTKHGVFVLLNGKLYIVPPGIPNGLEHYGVETTLVNL